MSWLPASMPGRSASWPGRREPAWTGGSVPGGLAGSTRWPRCPARSPCGPCRGARPGGRAEAGEPGPHRRAGRPGPARQRRMVAVGADPAAPLRAPGTGHPARRQRAARVRPVRGGPSNEMWTGDALHGPVIAGRKTYLFAFVDDHSWLITGHRFGHAEDTVRLAAALRPAWPAAAFPNASMLITGPRSWTRGCCAAAPCSASSSPTAPAPPPGTREDRAAVPHRPRAVPGRDTGDPAERGRRHVTSIAELNRLFTAWAETVYHRRVDRNRAGPADTVGPGLGRGRPAAARPRPAARGVLVERAPDRPQDRHSLAARQHLPGRPLTDRPESRAGLRPLRPGQHPGALERQPRRAGDPARHRPPLPPQSPSRAARPAPAPLASTTSGWSTPPTTPSSLATPSASPASATRPPALPARISSPAR